MPMPMLPDRLADRIELRGLTADTVIGVGARERRAPRPVVVDVVLEVDLRDAVRRDRLADTVDYAALAARVRRTVAASRVRLLEALAGRIARVCLAAPRVTAVEVAVRKPGALAGVTASVVIRRARHGGRSPENGVPPLAAPGRQGR